MKTNIIALLFILLFNGCVSKPTIKLEKIALITKESIEKKYLTHNYIKNMGSPEGTTNEIDRCVTTVPLQNKYFKLESNTFLEIVFSSKDKILTDYKTNKGLGQGIDINGGLYSPHQINFCPLVEENAHRFIYTYFYPTKTKTLGRMEDIRKLKELSLKVTRTGSLSHGITPAMRTNNIIITKEKIDDLFDKYGMPPRHKEKSRDQ